MYHNLHHYNHAIISYHCKTAKPIVSATKIAKYSNYLILKFMTMTEIFIAVGAQANSLQRRFLVFVQNKDPLRSPQNTAFSHSILCQQKNEKQRQR